MHDGHIIVDGCDKCTGTVCVHCCRRGTLCKTWKAWSTGVTNVKDHNNSESGRDTAVLWMVIKKSLYVSMRAPTTRFKPLWGRVWHRSLHGLRWRQRPWINHTCTTQLTGYELWSFYIFFSSTFFVGRMSCELRSWDSQIKYWDVTFLRNVPSVFFCILERVPGT